MKDLFFVVKIFVLSIALVMVLQVKHEGQTIEAKAESYFTSTQPVNWLKEQGRLIKKTFTKATNVAKSKLRRQLQEPKEAPVQSVSEYSDVNAETINREPGILVKGTEPTELTEALEDIESESL